MKDPALTVLVVGWVFFAAVVLFLIFSPRRVEIGPDLRGSPVSVPSLPIPSSTHALPGTNPDGPRGP